MKLQVSESIWLTDTKACSVEHVANVSGLAIDEVADLIECGLIAPLDKNAQPPEFGLHTIVTAKTARRLRDDFQLDRYGVALALTLLRRIDELETRIQAAEMGGRRLPDEHA